MFLELTQGRVHHAFPILILSAPGRFNPDETSINHIGRQGLNIFWQCARELRSIHPGNHYILLGSPHRRLSVGSEVFFENFQYTLMKLSFGTCQDIDKKLTNIEGHFEVSQRTTGQKTSKSTHACWRVLWPRQLLLARNDFKV